MSPSASLTAPASISDKGASPIAPSASSRSPPRNCNGFSRKESTGIQITAPSGWWDDRQSNSGDCSQNHSLLQSSQQGRLPSHIPVWRMIATTTTMDQTRDRGLEHAQEIEMHPRAQERSRARARGRLQEEQALQTQTEARRPAQANTSFEGQGEAQRFSSAQSCSESHSHPNPQAALHMQPNETRSRRRRPGLRSRSPPPWRLLPASQLQAPSYPQPTRLQHQGAEQAQGKPPKKRIKHDSRSSDQARDSARETVREGGLTFYPAYCHPLSPTYFSWVKMRACDIGKLRTREGFDASLMFYKNHPIQFVCIGGLVVARNDLPWQTVLTVDDASGSTVEVVCFRERATEAAAKEGGRLRIKEGFTSRDNGNDDAEDESEEQEREDEKDWTAASVMTTIQTSRFTTRHITPINRELLDISSLQPGMCAKLKGILHPPRRNSDYIPPPSNQTNPTNQKTLDKNRNETQPRLVLERFDLLLTTADELCFWASRTHTLAAVLSKPWHLPLERVAEMRAKALAGADAFAAGFAQRTAEPARPAGKRTEKGGVGTSFRPAGAGAGAISFIGSSWRGDSAVHAARRAVTEVQDRRRIERRWAREEVLRAREIEACERDDRRFWAAFTG